jgi:hypothetical protein
VEGDVLLQNDSIKWKHVNREHNGTENGALWDSAGETSLRTGRKVQTLMEKLLLLR